MRRVLIGAIFISLLIGGGYYFFEGGKKAELAVSVSGLPRGVKAKVEVRGPETYTVTGSDTREVKPGRYTIQVKKTTLKNKDVASGPDVSTEVTEGRTARVTAAYLDVVAANTRVFKSGEFGPLRVKGAKVYFAGGSKKAAHLAPGQYLLAGSSDNIEHPLIREVVSVTTAGSEIVVDTKPAELSKAMPKYHFAIAGTPPEGAGSAEMEPAAYQAAEEDPVLFEHTLESFKVGGEVNVADVHKYKCQAQIPPITYQLKDITADIDGSFDRDTYKVGGKIKERIDDKVEDVLGRDIIPDVTITHGMSASASAQFEADQKIVIDGPVSGNCTYTIDILSAVEQALTLGTGSVAKKAARVLKTCGPKWLKNSALGGLKLGCEPVSLTYTLGTEVTNIDLYSSVGFSSAIAANAGFNAKIDTKGLTAAKHGGVEVSPFRVTEPPREPRFRPSDKGMNQNVKATLRLSYTYQGGDPEGVGSFSFTAAASVGVGLVYRPQHQAIVLEGERKATLQASAKIDAGQLITPLEGVVGPVEVDIGKAELVNDTCKIAGPWYPFGQGDIPAPSLAPCKLSTDRGEVGDGGKFETPTPRNFPADLRLPLETQGLSGRPAVRLAEAENAASSESRVGYAAAPGPPPKFDPCGGAAGSIGDAGPDSRISDRRYALRRNDEMPDTVPLADRPNLEQQLFAFRDTRDAKDFLAEMRTDAKKCANADKNMGTVKEVLRTPYAGTSEAGFVARVERDMGEYGISHGYYQAARIANTIILTFMWEDGPLEDIGAEPRQDVLDIHRKFAKQLCARKEWTC